MAKELLQPVTPAIVQQVRTMIAGSQHAALAFLDPETGHPAISRVAMASLADGSPLLLTSRLAPHTSALCANPNCSLMIGEIGKGDPMAHPRIMAMCIGRRAPSEQREAFRRLFLAHHPKAMNYIDLPDFGFWKLDIVRISFVAGFGRACAISPRQLETATLSNHPDR